MKFLVAICLFFVVSLAVFHQINGNPIEQDVNVFDQSIEQDNDENPQVLTRFRRVTCDLLSFDTPFGSVNHAACAAHCLSMGKGFRGGYCENGVCHCRR